MSLLVSWGCQAATTGVDISNFSFQPASVTINVGDTVTWTQKDTAPHTSTSDDNLWNSPLLSLNQTFSHTFDATGSFPYFCAVHPFMKGSVSVQGAVANQPPTVSITSPTDGATFTAPASLTLQATASDSDGSIAKVEFFDGQASLGTATSSPFQVTANLGAGTHNLTAQATDNQGASTTSSAVSVTIAMAPANVPPAVNITSPTNGAAFTAPASLTLQATASDSDGSIAKVEFFDGQASLGTATNSPFQVTANLGAGTHNLTAQATDNQGASTTSSAVSITIAMAPANVPPTVSITQPASNALFIGQAMISIQAAASDTDGSIAQVEFFDSQTSLGTVTTSPFQITTNLAVGLHNLTARATDNQGASTASSVVPIAVVAQNALPTVAITSPTNGTVLVSPATLALQAEASDTDGSIARIEFFDGQNSLGTVTNSPYQVTATLVAGTHSLTAQATDDQGASANSSAVSVTVTNAPPVAALSSYVLQSLVSDLPGQAEVIDTNLVNPWALATSASSPFWIADNHSGVSTLYNSTGGVVSLVVSIPPAAGGQPPAAPTGMVFNGNTNDFLVASNQPARFIFATEDGTISGWNRGTNAMLMVDNSSSNAIYKGLALASDGTNSFLFAADFHNGRVDVFDSAFKPIQLPGGFTDATLPTGYAPFGIQNIAGNLYVTYALQDNDAEDDVPGAGHGFVNVFDPTGKMLKRFASQDVLNSPWGFALAPLGFGQFSGSLLIGNFGDGMINAFDPVSGAVLGHLSDTNGVALAVPGLWGLKFGNGGQGGEVLKLYFTAGISGGGSLEDHGLFGSITAVSAIFLEAKAASTNTLMLTWSAGDPPFLVQQKAALSDRNWTALLTTTNRTAVVTNSAGASFYRVLDRAPEQ